MKRIHIRFWGRKNGEKLKLHQQTLIKESGEKAIESLSPVFTDVLVKDIAFFELNLVCYGVLRKLTPSTIEFAKKNIQWADGSHFRPKAVNATDKFILFEKTVREDKTEYYSNAWSGDYNDLVIRLKKFQTWVDDVKNENSYGT